MFRPNSNPKKKRPIVTWGIIIASLFLTVVVFKNFPPLFLTQGVLYVAQPVISLEEKVATFFTSNAIVFKEKKELQSENTFLKQKIAEFEIRESFYEPVLQENKELKEVLSRNSERSFVLASILSRPGYGGYNTLLVDAGSNQGIKEGMQVVAFGNVLLVHVYEVTSRISKVRLISFPDEETNVFIRNNISAIAVGRGGENLGIILPCDSGIFVGDKIFTLGVNPLFLGIVEEIIRESADPFETILFRLPVNIQGLRYVFIVKDTKS